MSSTLIDSAARKAAGIAGVLGRGGPGAAAVGKAQMAPRKRWAAFGCVVALAAATEDVCARDYVRSRNGTLADRIAVVFRGEAFRNSGQQHMRGTCGCALSLLTQKRIYDAHAKWFALLEKGGLKVDVFAATRPCTAKAAYNATDKLREWYGDRMKAAVNDPDDGLPFAQVRNRERAIRLVRDHATHERIRYAHLLLMRWDFEVYPAKWRPGCVFDGTLKDAVHLVWHTKDKDKLQSVPGAFADCFFSLNIEDRIGPLITQPRCIWDACLGDLGQKTGLGRPPTPPPLVPKHPWREGECPSPWAAKVSTRADPRLSTKALEALAECERADPRRADVYWACDDQHPGKMQRDGNGCIRNGVVEKNDTAVRPSPFHDPATERPFPFPAAAHMLAHRKRKPWKAGRSFGADALGKLLARQP